MVQYPPPDLIPLLDMGYKTTPQQDFEHADRMVIEAITMRRCAEEIQAQAESMCKEADALQDAAKCLQRQASSDRRQIAAVYESTAVKFKHLLDRFDVMNPGALARTALAVEEGRLSLGHIHSFKESLRRFQSSATHQNESDNDNDSLANTSKNSMQGVLHDADQMNGFQIDETGLGEFLHAEEVRLPHIIDHNLTTSVSSDDKRLFEPSASILGDVYSNLTKRAKRRRRSQRRRKANKRINEDDELIVVEG